MNRFSRLNTLLLVTAATLALGACSGSDEDRLADDLAPPARVDVLAPPVAPDPNSMHPALQIARSRGVKTNVYFNEELQQAVARLNGMEETLGRLQGDLQGTAMAMQRVEMMRQEIDALNVRFQSLQERLMYAGPVLGPEPEPAMAPEVIAAPIVAPENGTTVTQTTTTITQPVAADNSNPAAMTVDNVNAPTPLTDAMVKPADMPKSAQMKPVVDDKKMVKAPAPEKSTGAAGVNDVRIGTHADRVRIVLDVTGAQAAFTTDLDATEKLLTVDLPKTKWSTGASETIKGNPLIASYAAQPSGDGSVIAFTLKGDTKVLETKTYKDADGKPGRLVIDLAR